MQNIAERIRLSAIQVWWSARDAAFIARSEQFPALSHANASSSLAAVDGLIDKICRAAAHDSAPPDREYRPG
ncbi:hypothetical protein ACWDOP_06215 [Nocardia sp. NPDC003693]